MYNEIVIAGILISIIYSEISGYSTGGMVAPVYLALNLKDPWRIAFSLLVVLLVWGADRLIGKFLILYGRRLFAVNVVLSFFFSLLIGASGIFPFGIRVIGYLVPALIVRDLERQGAVKTGLSVGIVTAFCALALLWVGML